MMPRRLLVLLLAIVPVSASAQPAGATTDYSTLFSRIMVELSTAIVLVSDEVETVADADAAESVVIATMQQTTKDLRYLLANLDGLVGNDPRGPREPSIIMLDSAVDRATNGADSAMAALERRNPTAAIRLQYLAHLHGEEATRLVDELMTRIDELRTGVRKWQEEPTGEQ